MAGACRSGGWGVDAKTQDRPVEVAVIGVGYVGLVTGASLARLGHRVVCADVDADKVDRLSEGGVPIHERGLDEVVNQMLTAGRLRFVHGAAKGVPGCEFVVVCVPTPPSPDGSADLTYLEAAVTEMAPYLDPGSVVVVKSTVPVGTSRLVGHWLDRADVAVASNPEFLREGSALHDFLNPDRVVIGSDAPGAAERVATLYSGVAAPVVLTDASSSEAIKYVANAFLATKLSFVNEVAALCEAVGADVDAVLNGMGHDRRIGHEFLRPGPGWGGSCFPKDAHALVRIAEDAGYDFALVRTAIQANEDQFDRVIRKIERALDGQVAGARIGVLGLSFKAGTDDVRDSPALTIIRRLIGRGALVRAYDPVVTSVPVAGVEVAADPYQACAEAAVVVVLTEWDEFAHLDLDRLAAVVDRLSVVDARNLLDQAALVARGFTYQGIGRS